MTTYAKPENLIEITPDGIRQAHPDISFPPSIEPHHVADLGYLPIESDDKPEIQEGEELKQGPLVYDADEQRIIRQWIVVPAPEPETVVPDRVTMRQARLALHAAGILPQVQPAINALPEPDKTAAQIEWDYSSEMFRNHGFVNILGSQLGLTSEQIDQLFIQAATL